MQGLYTKELGGYEYEDNNYKTLFVPTTTLSLQYNVIA
jgi:hypothetical protein